MKTQILISTVMLLAFQNNIWAGETPKNTKTPWQKKMEEYTQGLPKDAKLLIERMDECQHWSSEEPTSEARGAQIEEAIKKHKCESLDADREALLKKYKSNPKIKNKILGFKDL